MKSPSKTVNPRTPSLNLGACDGCPSYGTDMDNMPVCMRHDEPLAVDDGMVVSCSQCKRMNHDD